VQLGCTEPSGQLQKGQGVASGVADQSFGDLTRQWVTAAGVEELTGRGIVESQDLEGGQSGRGERGPAGVGGAGREDHGHRVCGQLSGGEQQGVRRSGVEPVRVVDHAQQRLVRFRCVGQHRQGGDPDQEGLDGGTVLEPERDPQRPRLGRRESVEVREGTEQAVQGGIREGRLGLHARGAQHPNLPTLTSVLDRGQVAQQGGLAHAGFSQQDQDGAGSGACLNHQGGKVRTFGLTAV
jgi:hypothetical protein